ncbi:flagellar hook-length control protein FliK [Clostridium pasteurianum]|uniref:flagellar hook-length control protein FliK n=1 Tax=Clostridium pasteurianum TaxID=1501 RepID=UPI002260DB99|nr:flagellar hook-length control protein FliK [Clostridium pasteurianum]UZW16064.1 flagellar hook-length control protein FliK [Clostridium pasteurianum]
MSEITEVTNLGKMNANITTTKSHKMQQKPESEFKQNYKFGDYLNEASKHNIDSQTKSSKNLYNKDIASEDSNNETVKKDKGEDGLQKMNDQELIAVSILQQLKSVIYNSIKSSKESASNDNDSYVVSAVYNKSTDVTKAISDRHQLIKNIEKELQKLVPSQDGNDVISEKQDNVKSKSVNLVLDKIDNLLSNVMDTKVDLKVTDKNTLNSNETLAKEYYHESLDPVNIDKSYAKSTTKTETNTVKQTFDEINKLLKGMLDKQSDVQSPEEINAIRQILSQLKEIEVNSDITSSSSVLTNSKNSMVSNNNYSNLIDKLISTLNSESTSENASKADNGNFHVNDAVLAVDNKSTDVTKIASDRDQLIKDIKRELQRLVSLQSVNSDEISEKQEITKSRDNNLILKKINSLLTDEVDIKTNLKSADKNTLNSNETLAKEYYHESLDPVNIDKSYAKETTKTETNAVKQTFDDVNKLLKGMLDKQSDVQYPEEINAIRQILSQLKEIEVNSDITSSSSVLTNSKNSMVLNNNYSNLIDKLISTLNSENILESASQNVSKADNANFHVNDAVLGVDNKSADVTNTASDREQLIKDIKNEVQKLVFLQSRNSDATSEKQESTKSRDINLILGKIDSLLTDEVDTKTNLKAANKNALNSNEISAKEYYHESLDPVNNIDKPYAKATTETETNLIDKLISKLNSENTLKSASEKVSKVDNSDFNITDIVLDSANNGTDVMNIVSSKNQLIKDIKRELQKLVSPQSGNGDTTLEKQASIKQDDIKTVLDKINNLLLEKTDMKVDLKVIPQSDLINRELSLAANEYQSERLSTAKMDKSSAKETLRSETNVVKQIFNGENNLLSTISDKQPSSSNQEQPLKNKDNKFLNNLIDNKDSGDKYSKVINVMNQFALNTAGTFNKNQDIQPQVINRDNFASDFIKSLNYMEDNNVKNMTVKILPKELGEIFIKVTSDGNIMKATITATNKDSYNLLNSNLHEINNLLNNQHIKIHSVDINIYNGDTTYFSGNNNFNNDQFNGSNENSSNNKSTTNFSNSNSEELDTNSQISTKEDNNVNVLV